MLTLDDTRCHLGKTRFYKICISAGHCSTIASRLFATKMHFLIAKQKNLVAFVIEAALNPGHGKIGLMETCL